VLAKILKKGNDSSPRLPTIVSKREWREEEREGEGENKGGRREGKKEGREDKGNKEGKHTMSSFLCSARGFSVLGAGDTTHTT
jgi:hypothetical protein